jgi:DNA repair protein RecO (recombination protein O)
MSRETSYKAIILKKQPYGEADEIVTFYSAEIGKLRALAKSSKFSKSKLQYGLQSLFLVNVTLAGSGLQKIIGVEILESFSKLRESFEATKISFFAVELVLKFSPDEQKNEKLFELLVSFLKFLNVAQGNILSLGLAKFKIEFLKSMGLGINLPSIDQAGQIGISNSQGGFLTKDDAVDYRPVSSESLKLFLDLNEASFSELSAISHSPNTLDELQELLSGFLTYQLERDIKSERFLKL